MLVHPDINPIAFVIGSYNVDWPFTFTLHIAVHWYGIMYLLSFLFGWAAAVYRTRKPHINWSREEVGDYLFYVVLGVVIGGRLGFMAFYKPELVAANPLNIFK